MVCGLPSSRIWKSPLTRPGTRAPCLSFTLKNTCTTLTRDLITVAESSGDWVSWWLSVAGGGVLTTPSCALRPGRREKKMRARVKMGRKRCGQTVMGEISQGDLLVYFYKLDASKENGAEGADKKV